MAQNELMGTTELGIFVDLKNVTLEQLSFRSDTVCNFDVTRLVADSTRMNISSFKKKN